MPVTAGSMGYPGQTGIYLPAVAVDEARNATGVALEYYANLDASWFTPSQYFADVTTATCRKCGTANVLLKVYRNSQKDIKKLLYIIQNIFKMRLLIIRFPPILGCRSSRACWDDWNQAAPR